MGRKKRKVGENGTIQSITETNNISGTNNPTQGQYGGIKYGGNTGIPPPPPPPAVDEPDTYLCKKYRYQQGEYRYITEFINYLKQHRMLEATFNRDPAGQGAAGHKKEVWYCCVSGTPLGYGRGSSRDKAIECACKASFHVLRR